MSTLCQNLSVSKNQPLTCINQEICGQNQIYILFCRKFLLAWNFVEITLIFMKIKEYLLAMYHGKF